MNKILIANRGEIALRVMRTAREMGIKTVAIFSEADRDAPFVKYADEVVCVGPPPSNESYLQVDKIIQICKDLKVDAVHPGYGFLSENADATRKFTKAGITFIGPSPKAMELMGDKLKEAVSSFGNGAVFIEKYVGSPRHIEIQIIADSHGNVVYLFERECSIQRRHQKVIEEAPSSVLTPEIREAMGKCAVDVARSCNYVGAGTVEFLLENNKDFYFLEMNTRLQVEHPVTEMISGIDLVKEQINIARGKKLSFTQENLKINGHAIEVRVYAEDPMNNFLPDIGKLNTYVRPEGLGIRVDDGFEEGMQIPIYYDPMISKLITHGKDREEAIERMIRAIDDYQISGVETTLPFGRFVMQHEAFINGNFDTNFVNKHFSIEKLQNSNPEMEEIAASRREGRIPF